MLMPYEDGDIKHTRDFYNVKILDRAHNNNKTKRSFLETIHIFIKSDTQHLSIIYSSLLSTLIRTSNTNLYINILSYYFENFC